MSRLLGVRRLASPVVPMAMSWLHFGVFTAVCVERLFGELSPAFLQFQVKLAVYVSAATTVFLGTGLVVAFGLGCLAALRWLAGSVDPGAVGRSVGLGTWVFAGYTATTAIAVLARPPEALTREDLAALARGQPDAEALLGIAWLTEWQYLAGGLFLAIVFVALSRVAGRVNALIATAFATAGVLFIGTLLRALAASLPGP